VGRCLHGQVFRASERSNSAFLHPVQFLILHPGKLYVVMLQESIEYIHPDAKKNLDHHTRNP
jgi:hypothetical protein